jgi:hypothetical protein
MFNQMEFFFKITKTQAEQIGKFEYKPNEFFDATAAPQKDGSYLISAELARNSENTEKFKDIDFDTCEIIRADQNDPVIMDIFKTEVKTKVTKGIATKSQTPISGQWVKSDKWKFIES